MISERTVPGLLERPSPNTLSEILPLKTGAFDLNDINVIKIGHRVIKAATYILLPCCLLT